MPGTSRDVAAAAKQAIARIRAEQAEREAQPAAPQDPVPAVAAADEHPYGAEARDRWERQAEESDGHPDSYMEWSDEDARLEQERGEAEGHRLHEAVWGGPEVAFERMRLRWQWYQPPTRTYAAFHRRQGPAPTIRPRVRNGRTVRVRTSARRAAGCRSGQDPGDPDPEPPSTHSRSRRRRP